MCYCICAWLRNVYVFLRGPAVSKNKVSQKGQRRFVSCELNIYSTVYQYRIRCNKVHFFRAKPPPRSYRYTQATAGRPCTRSRTGTDTKARERPTRHRHEGGRSVLHTPSLWTILPRAASWAASLVEGLMRTGPASPFPSGQGSGSGRSPTGHQAHERAAPYIPRASLARHGLPCRRPCRRSSPTTRSHR